MITAILKYLIIGIVRILSGISPFWKGCEPSRAQRVYFANHSSHMDFLTIWASLPDEVRSNTRPVAAKDYWDRSPFRRYLITKVFNAILIARPERGEGFSAASKGIRKLYEALDAGSSLIIFPEGTRTGDELSNFKPGVYHLAKYAPGVELIPVYLENMNRILPKGEILPVPFLGNITFGDPIQLNPGEKGASFLQRAKIAIETLRNFNEN